MIYSLSNYPFPIANIFSFYASSNGSYTQNYDCPSLANLHVFSASAGCYGSPLIFIPPTKWRNACLLPPKPTAPFLVRHHPEIVTSLNVLTSPLQHHLSHSSFCFLSFGMRHKKQPHSPPEIRKPQQSITI